MVDLFYYEQYLFIKGDFDWKANYIHIPIEPPFFKVCEFDIDTISFTLTQADLTIRSDQQNSIGIHLPNVLRRIEVYQRQGWAFDLQDIEQFVVLLSDIEEIFHYTIRKERINQYESSLLYQG